MSASIVPHLVQKDLRLMRGTIATFVVVSAVFIAILSFIDGHVPFAVVANLGFVMLIGPAATCGIVLLMKTNVFEKEKSTQPFIMSLPVTVKEFTRAKLIVNLTVFTIFWAAVSAVAFYFAFVRGLFPQGMMPFATMVLLGGYVAYTLVLSVSLITQNLGITVLCIALFETGTSAYMWTLAFLSPIRAHVWGPAAIWDEVTLSVVAAQATVAVLAIAATLLIQNTKRDFI